jgi:exodeoxyribonuclease V beta subunit
VNEGDFDVCAPLPSGITVLEASAGTGKTYTIAGLAARYVAEGTRLDQLLLVTFTRMATGELRDRVRERLVAVEQGLEADGARSEDEVVRLLADAPAEVVAARRVNLARALADFDAATIATTHGFCQEVLGGLGVVGDVERDVEFVEDVDDLLAEVVDDLYVRRFHKAGGARITRAEALRIATAHVHNPAARLEPADATAELPAMRYRLANAVWDELDTRKRRAGVITYDDLLTRLRDTLLDQSAVARLRARYRVVLVDEFQDTDPIQWTILRKAFGGGDVTLVLIGDPKQAIYAFRGADVYAYLEAARHAQTQATLRVNWRSDQGLIDAYDALFGDARLGHEGILYRTVRAADPSRRLELPGAPLRVRIVQRGTQGMALTRYGYAEKPSTRAHIARDVAADIVRLLESEGGVRPGDIAVLVRTNYQARMVREALDAVDVPAVINGAGSVFATRPARDWLRLLEAIERPTSTLRAHACALTPFLGWSAEKVATAAEEEWEAVHARLHRWAQVLRLEGVASLSERITLVEGLPARVLARADGERELTDLRHVGQLLHAAARSEQLGPAALTGWLRRRIMAAEQETGEEEHSRRLESDDEAVQVLTIHRSKGLEFPVVYCPFLWEGTKTRQDEPVTYHDEHGHLVVDVGLEGQAFKRHVQQHEIEERGEELRLAYVALTRAQHQAVIWWAGSFDSKDSALTRLLFSRSEDGTIAPFGSSTPTDAKAREAFEALAPSGVIAVETSLVGLPASWARPVSSPDAPPTATSPRRRTTRASGASPKSRWSKTSRTPRPGPASRPVRRPSSAPVRRPPSAVAPPRPCRWRACPRACRSARSSTASSRRPTSRRPTCAPSSRRGWRRGRRAGSWTSATRRR